MTNHDPTCIDLTVVVPVRNEAAYIGGLLGQFRMQTLEASRYEIIVVDGMSGDGTLRIVEDILPTVPNLRILVNPRIRASAARNIGVAEARAPYVLFVDGHCRLMSDQMLERVAAAFRNGEVCVSRPQPQLTDQVSTFQRAAAVARNSRLGHYAGSCIYDHTNSHTNPASAGCGYSVSLYRELGGMDESFDACEDLEFNIRVHYSGIQAYHSPDFAVGYEPRPTMGKLFHQMFRYGYGRSRLARKHWGEFSALTTLLGALVAMLYLLPVVALKGGGVFQAWLAIYGGYAALAAIGAAFIARHLDFRGRCLTWLCLLAIHHGGGLGYLCGLVGGTPKVK